jgi:hypothetical protein
MDWIFIIAGGLLLIVVLKIIFKAVKFVFLLFMLSLLLLFLWLWHLGFILK